MRRAGRQSRFDAATIALAMELRTDGIGWKLIARYLGDGIYYAAKRAKRTGVTPYVR